MWKIVVERGPAAGLWLLAMAAQVSGFNNVALALALIGFAAFFFVAPACHHAHAWRKQRIEAGKRTVTPFYLIAVGLGGIAVFAVLAFAGVLWMGTESGVHNQQQTPVVHARPEFLKDLFFTYDSQLPLAITGIVAETSDRLRIYVETSTPIIPGRWGGRTPRILIEEIKDRTKGESFQVQLLYPGPIQHVSQTEQLYWGNPSNHSPVGRQTRVRLIVVGPDKTEQTVYFMVIYGMQNQRVTVWGESEFDWIREWKTEDGG